MDRFFKFWEAIMQQKTGAMTMAAAMEELIRNGIKSSRQVLDLFEKSYGIKIGERNTKDWKAQMEKAMSDFNASLEELVSAMGVVPKSTYQALLSRHEKLKQKVAEQEETIRQLRRMLGEKGAGAPDGTQAFSEMIATQQKQFEQLMRSMAALYAPEKKEKESDDGE